MATTDPIKMLEQTADGFKKIADNIKKIKIPDNNKAMQQLRDQTVNLVKQNEKLVQDLKILKKNYDDLAKKAEEYGSAIARAENVAEQAAKKSQKTTKDRINLFGTMMKKTSLSLGAAGEFFKRQLVWYPTKAATFAFMNAMRAIPAVTAEYGQALKDIEVIGRMTDKELKNLSKTIEDVGVKTKFSMVEVAKASKTLVQAGLRGEELVKAIDPLTAMAAATSATLESAARLQTTVMRAYNMSANDFMTISDGVVNAVSATRLSLEDLNTAFSYVASAAQQTGVSFTQSITLLGLLRNAGLEASTAATGLRMALLKITAPTRKAQKVLDAVGLSQDDLDIANRGIYEVLKSLNKLTKQNIIDIFGARSANAMLVFRNISIETAESLEKLIQIQGTASAMQALQLETLSGSWKLLFDNMKAMANEFGQTFKEDVIEGIKTFISLIQTSTKSIKDNKEAITGLIKAFTGFAALAVSTAIGASMFKGVIDLVKSIKYAERAINILAKRFGLFTKVAKPAITILAGFSTSVLALAGTLSYVGYFILQRAHDLAKFQSNVDSLKTSLAGLNVTLEDTSVKFSQAADLQISPEMEKLFVAESKEKLREKIIKNYEAQLSVITDPATIAKIKAIRDNQLKNLTKVTTFKDFDDFKASIYSVNDNITEVLEQGQKDLEKKAKELAFEPGTYNYYAKQWQMLEDAKKLGKRNADAITSLLSSGPFTMAKNMIIGMDKDLKIVEKSSNDRLKVFTQAIENAKTIDDGIKDIRKRMRIAAKTSDWDVYTQLFVELNKLQEKQSLLKQFKTGDLTGNLEDLVDPITKVYREVSEQVNSEIQKELRLQLKNATSEEDKRKIIEKYYANFPKMYEQGMRSGLAKRHINFSIVTKYLEEEQKRAIAKGKQAILTPTFQLDAENYKKSAKQLKAEAKLIISEVYRDNYVTTTEYDRLIEAERKKHAANLKEIDAAIAIERKNSLSEAEADNLRKIKIETENNKHTQNLLNIRKQSYDQQVKDVQNLVKQLNINELTGSTKIEALNLAKQAYESLLITLTTAKGFDVNNPAFKVLIDNIKMALVSLDAQIEQTNDNIYDSQLSKVQRDIDNLTTLRDYAQAQGRQDDALKYNEALLNLHRQQLGLVQARILLEGQETGDIDWLGLDAAEAQFEMFRESLDSASNQAREMTQNFKNEFSNSFASFFDDLVTGSKSVSEAFRDMASDILTSFQKIISKKIAEQLFDSIFGSATSSSGSWLTGIFKWFSTFHTGGEVKATSPKTRMVNPLVFANAPRLHSGYNLPGVRQDEFPAILQQGETVLPKNTTYASAVPNVTINLENKSSQKVSMRTTGTEFDGEEYIINTIIQDAANNGPMRQVL